MSFKETGTTGEQRSLAAGWALAGGVAVSVAVSILLHLGTPMIDYGLSLLEYEDLRVGVILAAAVGVILAFVVVMARLHPLLSGVPAVWLLIAYVPPVLSPNALVRWYPEPILTFVSETFGPAPFVVLGALATAAIRATLTSRTSNSDL